MLENPELVLKGKSRNDLTSIKNLLRWQSRGNSTLAVDLSKDTTDEDSDTEVEVLAKLHA